MPRTDRLHRKRPRREPYPRFLIVCEGEKTEPGYFQHLRHTARLPVRLEIVPGGTPKTLVEKAVRERREAERLARRKKDPWQRFDEVWCVFDIDEHPFVPETKQQARDNSIRLAISNPCFELWVLLHFQDQRGELSRHSAQSLCRQHLPGYQKDLPCDELTPRRPDAIRRAVDLEAWQQTRGCEGGNPSTQVHHLVERLLAVRRESAPSEH
ncbi:MAG: RloB domain-containing protein [Bryobacterales bacterium]|nr:RloB domain-containing protein [Bryobacterales bacterium]